MACPMRFLHANSRRHFLRFCCGAGGTRKQGWAASSRINREPAGPKLYRRIRKRHRGCHHENEADERNSLSVRTMAKAQRVSRSTVQRVWRKHKLQPHRVESFKFSTDPDFVAKLRDVTGLYMNPPDKAIVLSVDEKSQIQALDRTQPILPLRPELPERQTHDYQRHGTTTLFAALNVLEGTVIGQCQPRHRHQEFLLFLDRIEASVPRRSCLPVIDGPMGGPDAHTGSLEELPDVVENRAVLLDRRHDGREVVVG